MNDPSASTKTLAMFPGQGSQSVGMGRDLLSEFPYLKEIFEEAEDASQLNIRKLCFDGPAEELTKTANQQPCILTVTTAVWSVLQNETDLKPDFFAGHSLGEYSALVAAKKLSLSNAASLVRKRGQAMQKAVPEGVGSMAAVMNCDTDELLSLCQKHSNENVSVEVVNFNSPQQLIISGHLSQVDRVLTELESKSKVRCVKLPVSAPFHSKLMAPAREEMTPLLNSADLAENDARVIANLSGKIEENYTAKLLIEQIDSPVLWTQSLQSALEAGCGRYVEIGPGKVLFSLARKSLPRGQALMNSSDIKKMISELN
jgi:[acyl-carrier-protein] S-malonyltransferase